jgi:formylglycine-generating enzyme required for sulfatase activity
MARLPWRSSPLLLALAAGEAAPRAGEAAPRAGEPRGAGPRRAHDDARAACAARVTPAASATPPRDDAGAVGSFRDPFLDGSGWGPELVRLEGGAFEMGSAPGTPGAQPLEVPHRVELAPFAMARREVSNAEYARFLREVGELDADGVPYAALTAERFDRRAGQLRAAPGAEELPVVSVSWRGALAYAAWLARATGQRYRLPSEAEWEWAAHAGRGSGGINCAGAAGRLAAVGTSSADARGLFDLLGNAWEWTLDCFAMDFYLHAPVRDPRALDPGCLTPGIRGGSFQDTHARCRPGFRVNYWWRGAPSIGFRVVRDVPTSDVSSPRGDAPVHHSLQRPRGAAPTTSPPCATPPCAGAARLQLQPPPSRRLDEVPHDDATARL